MPQYIFVYPHEFKYISPLKRIADYIKSRDSKEVSRHHITRLFDPLEEFLQSRRKMTALAKVMEQFARHYGFKDEKERAEVEKAVCELLDWLAIERSKDPVGIFKTLRELRTLLIGLVYGYVKLEPIPYEKKQFQKEV